MEAPINAPRLNRRQRAKAVSTAKVLEAALSLFEEVGYEAATIRAIAKRAGMSTGAVFANYRDKADVYLAAYGHPPMTPEDGRRLAALLDRLLVEVDDEIEQRKTSGLAEYSAVLEALSNEAHAALKAVRSASPGKAEGEA